MRVLVVVSVLIVLVIGLASCKQDGSTTSVVNRDPNGTSELQLSMREMYDHFEKIKADVIAGKDVSDVEIFDHILTDTPTEAGKNATDIYKSMAASYFYAVEQLKVDQDLSSFELIVDTCMNCHKQICPGPMVKIKKLYI